MKRRRNKVKVKYPCHMLLKLPANRRAEIEKKYARIANRSLFYKLNPVTNKEEKEGDVNG